MVWHSAQYRGKQTTLFFFTTCTVYAILRGHAVRYITTQQWGRAAPYTFAHQTLQIWGEPILAIIGWIFTIYLSWCLAERMLQNLHICSSNLFALSVFGFLCTASICYVVEAAAASAHWWKWSLSLKNAWLVSVPAIGLVDWSAIISDFLIPFLLFFLSPLRAKVWRWLLILPFAIHMLGHTPFQFFLPIVGYFFVVVHIVIFLVPFLLAFWAPSWARLECSENDAPGRSRARHVPFAAVLVLIIVGFGVHAKAGFPQSRLISFAPMLLVSLLAFVGFRACATGLAGIALLGAFHDTRWLVAASVPLLGVTVAWGNGVTLKSLWGSRTGDDQARPRIGYRRLFLSAFAMLLCALIAWREYTFEQRCKDFEQQAIRPLIAKIDLTPEILESAIRKAPDDANYLSGLAEILETNRAPLPLIAALCARAIEVDPEYTVPYSILATIQARTGLLDQAIRTMEMAHKADPYDARILSNLGFHYHQAHQDDKAVQTLRKAAEINPRDHVVWLNLTQAHLQKGDLTAALECLQRAERLRGTDPDIKTMKVMLDLAAGRLEHAESQLREICSKHPRAVLVRIQLARLLNVQGRLEESLSLLEEASAIQVLPLREWSLLAQSAEKAGDNRTLVKALRATLLIQPDSLSVMAKLAQALSNTQRHDEARELYSALVEREPGNAILHLNLGATLHELGDLEGALDETSRAQALKPGLAVADYNLGLIRMGLGDFRGAISAYRSALEKDSAGDFLTQAFEDFRKAQAQREPSADWANVEAIFNEAFERRGVMPQPTR